MSTQIIKINRGDSFEFSVRIPNKKDFSKNDLLNPNEVLYFALLYPNQRFEDAILIRAFDHTDAVTDDNEVIIKLTPNDTRNLAPGIYYYTVKLQRGGTFINVRDADEPDEVRTIIERTKFIINE